MKRRIIICLGILLALCLVGDVVAMFLLNRSVSTLNDLTTSYDIQFYRAELVYSGIRIEEVTSVSMDEFIQGLNNRNLSIERFRESLNHCSYCHHEPEVEKELDGIHGLLASYVDLMSKLTGNQERPDADKIKNQLDALSGEMRKNATDMSERASRHMKGMNQNAADSARNAWWNLSWSLVAVLISGGFVAFHLKSRMTKPVEGLLEGIKRVRSGDLTHRITVRADEEFCTLADAFNQAYEDLKKAQENILQAEKMAAVGKMAAGVAHEVGNPLASISSIVQIARRDSNAGLQAERTGLIMDEVKRISRIIQNLLTFSKPPSDETNGLVDVAKLLDRATTLLLYDKRAKTFQISFEQDGELKPIHGNSDRLLSVFTNIILNASDAIASSGKEDGFVKITAGQEEERVVIRFEDNGTGMNEEQQANAFDPFYTTKEPGHGTGLGLWICYQEIHRHGGTIQIHSHEGEGTTVILDLHCPSDGPA